MILLLCVCLYKIKASHFNSEYLSVSQTGAIKGIFAVIILFSHLRGYVALSDSFMDGSYNEILNNIGQLMVAVFFFYSGYGVLESYKRKEGYAKGFFKNRILKTLVHMDIAVLCFLVLSLVLRVKYPVQNYFLCWIGWEALGNSNWFLFVTLAMYVFTLAVFAVEGLFKRKNYWRVFLLTGICCCALWIFLYKTRTTYWHDTLMCYPFGMLYSLAKDKIDTVLRKSSAAGWIAIAGSVAVFAATFAFHRLVWSHSIVYNACACLLCFFITMLTTKIKIENKILTWLGNMSFLIYIFQRIPMIIFKHIGLAFNTYLFAVLSIIATGALCVLFDWVYKKIDLLLFKRVKEKK